MLHAVFAPNGDRVLTCGEDGTARIWDAMTGQQISVLDPHGGVCFDAEYNSGGTRVVTASLDEWVRVWDAGTGALLLTYPGPSNGVRASFSPDGRWILADREVIPCPLCGGIEDLLRVAPDRVSRDLTAVETTRYLPS